MKTRVPPREDLALDPEVVRSMVGAPRGAGCVVKVLQRKAKRLIIRYDIEGSASVVGKWYSSDRGALVYDALRWLRSAGFDSAEASVPAPVTYVEEARVLFVAAIDGPTLRDLVSIDPASASRAGVWLARFHRSGFDSPRDCGPSKMIGSVRRWSGTLPGIAPPLLERLEAEINPGLPVHYDYYPAQVICPPGAGAVVVDLDESGLGDPGFDVAHFIAHLQRLGVREANDPDTFAEAEAAFLDGYSAAGGTPDVRRPVHDAFAWYKLGSQAVARSQAGLAAYATRRLRRILGD